MRRALVPLLVAPLLALAACGGGSASGASGSLPTASGSFGHKPKLTFPSGKPPAKLETKVLKQGDGATVKKGDLLVADYLGQIWHGKVFDNSYDRHAPAAFPIGVGQVVPGWDKALVGAKAGSRLELVLPPAEGYGKDGNPQAGIKGTDTLVFVVDVIGSYDKTAAGQKDATPQKVPADGPQVGGPLGGRPTITVPKGAPQPKTEQIHRVAVGNGPPVKPGLVVVQYEAVDWSGKPMESTYDRGTPFGMEIGNPSQPNPLDILVGVRIGSRVLIELPAQPNQAGATATAVVLDVVAQPTSA